MVLPDILYKVISPNGVFRAEQTLTSSDGHEIAQPEVGIGNFHAISFDATNVL